MNAFTYTVFKTVFMSMKHIMHSQRLWRDFRTKLPSGVIKKSYRYWQQGHETQECNLYLPSNQKLEKKPLLVDIHGGCWLYGDKDVYDRFSYYMVLKGFDVSSLTYRTIDQVHLKHQVQDVFDYFHFLEANQQEMKIDLNQASLTGDSAGAQLAFLSLCINQSEKLQKIFEVKPFNIEFKSVILTHPVCFIDEAARLPRNNKISENISIPGLQRFIYGKDFKDQIIHSKSVNPYGYLQKGMKFPDILLVTSKGDKMFKNQTYMLADLLFRYNIPYTLYYEEDKIAGHVFNLNDPGMEQSVKCNNYIVDFIRKNLNKEVGESK